MLADGPGASISLNIERGHPSDFYDFSYPFDLLSLVTLDFSGGSFQLFMWVVTTVLMEAGEDDSIIVVTVLLPRFGVTDRPPSVTATAELLAILPDPTRDTIIFI